MLSIQAIYLMLFCPLHPIYGSQFFHFVYYFHRLSFHLHHICTSGDARKGNPHAFIIQLSSTMLIDKVSVIHQAGVGKNAVPGPTPLRSGMIYKFYP